MTKEEIAEVLKKARIQAGLTQKQTAEKLGRKQQTLASWETGQSQPDANTLFELFSIYGVSVDEAFGFSCAKNSMHEIIDLTLQEQDIIKKIRSLNESGKTKINFYLEDLLGNPANRIYPDIATDIMSTIEKVEQRNINHITPTNKK